MRYLALNKVLEQHRLALTQSSGAAGIFMRNSTPLTIMLATRHVAVQKRALDDLQSAGYAVQVTTDGAATLSSIKGCLPDLLIVDSDMNTPEGESLVLYLNAEARYQPLPLVIVLATPNQVPKWFFTLPQDRVNCFITVPFGSGELPSYVRRIFEVLVRPLAQETSPGS